MRAFDNSGRRVDVVHCDWQTYVVDAERE
jgi:hypothetical protein